jgi:hypothetical protein
MQPATNCSFGLLFLGRTFTSAVDYQVHLILLCINQLLCLAWHAMSHLLLSCRAAPSTQLGTIEVHLSLFCAPTSKCHLPRTGVFGLVSRVPPVVFVQSRTFKSAGNF